MRRGVGFLLLLSFLGVGTVWGAEPRDEDLDLELIPRTVQEGARERESSGEPLLPGKGYLENALTGWVKRHDLLVPVPSDVASWQNRTSADLDYNWQVAPALRLGLSDRLSIFAGNAVDLAGSGTLRNDLREGFLSLEPAPRSYLEAGRINLKNGAALGFNPTDYFKARSTVDLASLDPSAQRENRLGTVLLQGQVIWDDGALTVAFAPKLQNPTPLGQTAASFDPLFGQTNAENRILVSLSSDLAGLNPQLLLFHDDIGTHLGANLSRVMTKRTVAYLEWSGVRQGTLTSRAVAFGEETGTLPPGLPPGPRGDRGEKFCSDLALGASWTGAGSLTVNLEYHYHQAGLGGGDFDRWLSLGRSAPLLSRELWYIRQYAADRQEPLMQHQFFLRFAYPDAVQSRLDLSGVFFISPYDGSTIAQVSAQYFISREWTIGAYLGGITGGRSSVAGSLPWRASGVVQVVRYL